MTTPQPLSVVRKGLLCVAAWIALAGCSSAGSAAPTIEPVRVAPERAVLGVSTTACGHASKTIGSGVAVAPGLVLTAAHVVVGADEVDIHRMGALHSGQLVAMDPTKDLALIEVPRLRTIPAARLQSSAAEPGAPVTIAGAVSGVVPTKLGRRLTLRVDDVRAATRSERAGWELPVTLVAGDSGAPVFDRSGSIVAVVFSGAAARNDRTFAIAAPEVADFLRDAQHGDWACDPGEHRQMPVG